MLDVYKRQAGAGSAEFAAKAGVAAVTAADAVAAAKQAASIAALLPANNLAGPAPVSYTHLDVYKRQVQYCKACVQPVHSYFDIIPQRRA